MVLYRPHCLRCQSPSKGLLIEELLTREFCKNAQKGEELVYFCNPPTCNIHRETVKRLKVVTTALIIPNNIQWSTLNGTCLGLVVMACTVCAPLFVFRLSDRQWIIVSIIYNTNYNSLSIMLLIVINTIILIVVSMHIVDSKLSYFIV